MQFNKALFTAIENKDEKEIVEQFQPLVKKLSTSEDTSFQGDIEQELDIEVIKVFRNTEKKLKTDFNKYLKKIDIID